MDSDASNAEDLAALRNLQYIVPQKQTLYLESKFEPLESERSLAHLWRTQSILVMAHIFEALDHIEVIVSAGSEVEIDGKKLAKPVLVVHRDPAKANVLSPAYEVITDTVQIICEHFYKFYIFTHLIEKREDRVARPVVSGELESAEADPSTWVVQPKNSNVLVRSLRGKRKVALQVRTPGLIEPNFPFRTELLILTFYCFFGLIISTTAAPNGRTCPRKDKHAGLSDCKYGRKPRPKIASDLVALGRRYSGPQTPPWPLYRR